MRRSCAEGSSEIFIDIVNPVFKVIERKREVAFVSWLTADDSLMRTLFGGTTSTYETTNVVVKLYPCSLPAVHGPRDSGYSVPLSTGNPFFFPET